MIGGVGGWLVAVQTGDLWCGRQDWRCAQQDRLPDAHLICIVQILLMQLRCWLCSWGEPYIPPSLETTEVVGRSVSIVAWLKATDKRANASAGTPLKP